MSNDKKSPSIAIFVVVAIVAVAGALAWMLFSAFPVGGGSDVARTGADVGQRTGEPAVVPANPSDAVERPTPTFPEGLVPAEEMDDEQWEENAREAARALNDGQDPTPCEHTCDCPQGMACQQGSQLCLPSPFKVYCCDKDGCPEGEQCEYEEGGYGVCGEKRP